MVGAQILIECFEREGVSGRRKRSGRDAGAEVI